MPWPTVWRAPNVNGATWWPTRPTRLRTPLSNIRGYVEAVRDGVLKPDPETLGTIHQQVLYLTDLVDDLRLLAETEAGDFGLNREPGSLFEAVRTSVEGVRARAEAEGVVLGG